MATQKLLECQFLIPLFRDSEISEGEPHEPKAWRWLEVELVQRFDGWCKTSETHEGAWKSTLSGKVSHDISRRYFVAVPKNNVKELRAILQLACVEFAQQCIYLSVAGNVEFVEAQQ
jgi:hypothetical protein